VRRDFPLAVERVAAPVGPNRPSRVQNLRQGEDRGGEVVPPNVAERERVLAPVGIVAQRAC
jgi:hypothetical protein